MNPLIRHSSLLIVSAALAATGCSKKSETPAVPATPAASAPAAKPATDLAKETAEASADLAAAARQKAEASAKAMEQAAVAAKHQAEEAATHAQQKADAAIAAAKMKVEQGAAALKQKADEAAATAPMAAPGMTPPMAAGTGQSDLAGAANLAASQAGGTVDALKVQASQLLSQYSGQLATLKTNAVALKGLIDKNASMLPAGVSAKYQELNSMLPQLTGLVDTLKNYQTADLTTVVPKLKADFSKAQKLYAEINGLMPQ